MKFIPRLIFEVAYSVLLAIKKLFTGFKHSGKHDIYLIISGISIGLCYFSPWFLILALITLFPSLKDHLSIHDGLIELKNIHLWANLSFSSFISSFYIHCFSFFSLFRNKNENNQTSNQPTSTNATATKTTTTTTTTNNKKNSLEGVSSNTKNNTSTTTTNTINTTTPERPQTKKPKNESNNNDVVNESRKNTIDSNSSSKPSKKRQNDSRKSKEEWGLPTLKVVDQYGNIMTVNPEKPTPIESEYFKGVILIMLKCDGEFSEYNRYGHHFGTKQRKFEVQFQVCSIISF